MVHILKCENNAVTFRVGLPVNFDLAIDHRHDAVAKLLVNESLDRSTVDEDTLSMRAN